MTTTKLTTKQDYIDRMEAFAREALPHAVIYGENPAQDYVASASIYISGGAPESYIKISVKSNAWAPVSGEPFNPFEHECDVERPTLQTYDGITGNWRADQHWLPANWISAPAEALEQLRTFASQSEAAVRADRERAEKSAELLRAKADLEAAAAEKPGTDVRFVGGLFYSETAVVVTTRRSFTSAAEAAAYIASL